jgi:hypothetical protein
MTLFVGSPYNSSMVTNSVSPGVNCHSVRALIPDLVGSGLELLNGFRLPSQHVFKINSLLNCLLDLVLDLF